MLAAILCGILYPQARPELAKSVFGFFLLHLPRCQGKTVLFEREGYWYRFSDEGVKEGRLATFGDADLLGHPDSWYLSDPTDRPGEMFGGITVVLAAPNVIRVNEFLKQAKSKRLFMPVWSEDELLKCRGAVFPHVRRTDVQKAFGVVGDVARSILHVEKLGQIKENMESNVVDVGLLRAAAWGQLGRISTYYSGDSLFHIFSGGEKITNLARSDLPATPRRMYS